MNVLRIFLYGAVCCVQAVAGVRLVDVATESSPCADALETVGDRVRDSASCRKLTEEWNQQADREEKRWKEAYLSGYPTPQEWLRMAEYECRMQKRIFEKNGEAEEKEKVSLMQLEEDGVISHEDAEQVYAALRRLLFVSKTAVDSLEDVIARAELPLPSSQDGDSHEKLLAWKWNPEHSLAVEVDRDPVTSGRMKKVLKSCWNAGVMESLNGFLVQMNSERLGRLIRQCADRKVEEAERMSKLPPLTPEQWCWVIKQEHEPEALDCSVGDLLICFSMWKELKDAPEECALKASFRYFQEAPDKVVRVWKEKIRQEKGR